MQHKNSSFLPYLYLIPWFMILCAGYFWTLQYMNTPGELIAQPAKLSKLVKVQDSTRMVLVFLHPGCPCSEASVEELGDLAAVMNGKTIIRALFYKPVDSTDSWAQKGLWQKAASIPGIECGLDVDGKIAIRYGAKVSGTVICLDGLGHQLYRGGITISRGHRGENPGKAAVRNILNWKKPDRFTAPVFGCNLISR
jgi:hypothetical protein